MDLNQLTDRLAKDPQLATVIGYLAEQPELIAKLGEASSAQNRLDVLKAWAASMTDQLQTQTDENRKLYLEREGAKYKDIDVARALMGIDVSYAVKIPGTVLHLRPVNAAARKIVSGLGISPDLQEVLASLTKVEHQDQPPAIHPPIERLTDAAAITQRAGSLSQLPELLIARLAQASRDFSGYLAIYLEANLGN